jgi:hypothetical protein
MIIFTIIGFWWFLIDYNNYHNKDYTLYESKQTVDSLKTIKLENFKNFTKIIKQTVDSLKAMSIPEDNLPETIKIIKYYTLSPNLVGGVGCNIIWKNLSEKTIKYITFTVAPYNKVNDRVNSEKNITETGPVKSKQISGTDIYWGCVWYNVTIDYMLITGIKIQYLDGSTISTDDINIIQKLGYTRKPNKLPNI